MSHKHDFKWKSPKIVI